MWRMLSLDLALPGADCSARAGSGQRAEAAARVFWLGNAGAGIVSPGPRTPPLEFFGQPQPLRGEFHVGPRLSPAVLDTAARPPAMQPEVVRLSRGGMLGSVLSCFRASG